MVVNHDYWVEVYPTGKFDYPWKVEVTETRGHSVIEVLTVRTEDEGADIVKSYWNRYGKDKARYAEHVYYIAPNKRLAELLDGYTNDES